MQTFLLGLRFDQTRAGHNHGQLDVLGHFLTEFFNHSSRFAHVLNPAVGARTNEHLVDKQVVQGLAGFERHVGQGAFNRTAFVRVFFFVGVGHDAIDVQHHLGRGAPGDLRQDGLGLELDHGVKLGVRVGLQRFPIGHRLVPFRTTDKLTGFGIGAG